MFFFCVFLVRCLLYVSYLVPDIQFPLHCLFVKLIQICHRSFQFFCKDSAKFWLSEENTIKFAFLSVRNRIFSKWSQEPTPWSEKLIRISFNWYISLITLTFLAKNLVITISLFIFARKNKRAQRGLTFVPFLPLNNLPLLRNNMPLSVNKDGLLLFEKVALDIL